MQKIALNRPLQYCFLAADNQEMVYIRYVILYIELKHGFYCRFY